MVTMNVCHILQEVWPERFHLLGERGVQLMKMPLCQQCLFQRREPFKQLPHNLGLMLKTIVE